MTCLSFPFEVFLCQSSSLHLLALNRTGCHGNTAEVNCAGLHGDHDFETAVGFFQFAILYRACDELSLLYSAFPINDQILAASPSPKLDSADFKHLKGISNRAS